MFTSKRYSTVENSPLSSYSPVKVDSLKDFHYELNGLLDEKKKKKNKASERKKTLPAIREISALKTNVSSLKSQLMYKQKQHQTELKLSALLAERNILRNPNFLPKLPYHYPPHHFQTMEDQNSDEEPEEKVTYRPKRRQKRPIRSLKKLKKPKRPKKDLVRIMKKVFRAVGYIELLKKLTKKIVEKRKYTFEKFWPSMFEKSVKGVGKWFQQNCKRFFTIMVQKKDSELSIDEDESEALMNQKKKIIKKLVQILLECIRKIVESQSFQEVSRIIHIFCKHGAFIDNGVLTPQEMEVVCISETHNYLRLDKALEISQIINIFFIKIVIYNLLLQPWKYNPEKYSVSNKQTYENFYFFSSVFYQLICQVQQTFINEERRFPEIRIGNWNSISKKIKCSGSLCHLNHPYEEGELISGLIPEEKLQKIFPSRIWKEEREALQSILQRMHEKLRKIHWRFINEVYNYKDVSRVK